MLILTDHKRYYAQINSFQSQQALHEYSLSPITQLAHIHGEPKCEAFYNSNPCYTKTVSMGEDSWSHYAM